MVYRLFVRASAGANADLFSVVTMTGPGGMTRSFVKRALVLMLGKVSFPKGLVEL